MQVKANASITKSDYNKRYRERNKLQDFLYHLDNVLRPDSKGIYKEFIDLNTATTVDSYIKHFKEECKRLDMDIFQYIAMYDVEFTSMQHKALVLLMDIDIVSFGAQVFKFSVENDKTTLNRLKNYIYSQFGKYGLDSQTKQTLCDNVFQSFVKILYSQEVKYSQLQMYSYISTLVLGEVRAYRQRQKHMVNEAEYDIDVYIDTITSDVVMNSFANQEQECYINGYLNEFECKLHQYGIESMFDFMQMLDSMDNEADKLYLVEGVKTIVKYKVNLSESDMRIVRDFIANSVR